MKKLSLRLINIGFLISGLFLSGCLDTPIPPFIDQDIISDDKMIGQWIPMDTKTDDDLPIYTVVPSGDKLYRLHIMESGKESLAQMTLFKLGDQTYLSVSYADSEEIDTLRYDWEHEALKVKGFNREQFVELSKREKLDIDFTINEQKMIGTEVSFNATTEELRSFLKSYGSQVFTDTPIEFKRLGE